MPDFLHRRTTRSAAAPSGPVAPCVVARGRSVRFNGQMYLPGDEVILPVTEIERLAPLGFVVPADPT